jgi:hypothetical protein
MGGAMLTPANIPAGSNPAVLKRDSGAYIFEDARR